MAHTFFTEGKLVTCAVIGCRCDSCLCVTGLAAYLLTRQRLWMMFSIARFCLSQWSMLLWVLLMCELLWLLNFIVCGQLYFSVLTSAPICNQMCITFDEKTDFFASLNSSFSSMFETNNNLLILNSKVYGLKLLLWESKEIMECLEFFQSAGFTKNCGWNFMKLRVG